MDTSSLDSVATFLLRGTGYFGNLDIFRLAIPVGQPTNLIHFEILSGSEGYLNLAQIALKDLSNNKIPLQTHLKAAYLSSAYKSDADTDVKALIIAGQSIHTGKERAPRLTLELNSPINVGQILIRNRQGLNGQRSRNLVVTCWKDNDEVVRYLNSSPKTTRRMIKSLAERADFSFETDISTENRQYIAAAELQQKIAHAVKEGKLDLSHKEALALLPLYEQDPLINDNILVFAAAALAHIVSEHKSIQTGHLKAFRHILSSAERINKVTEYTREFLKKISQTEDILIVGKHKIGTESLLSKKEEYKKVIHIVTQQLSDWGHEAVLCYGTLLGAIRDEGFIPHDDDVDMLYFHTSTNRDQMMRDRLTVLEKFKDAGYKIWDSGTNFHVTPKGHTVGIDLFPCWTEGAYTSLMMEKYIYRTIKTSILKPISSTPLYGETYNAPNDSKTFLQERYGTDWSVSNPYHEWPWELDGFDQLPERSKTRKLDADRPLMIAWGQHLGPGGKSPPKNSPSLITEAVKTNFDAIELDVRLSKDRHFVLGHDDTIKNQAGQTIKISASSARTLEKFSLGAYKGEDNHILKLRKALPLLKDKYLHLDPRIDPEDYPALRTEIDKSNFMPERIIFCCYGDNAIKALRAHFPESVILNKYYSHFKFIDDYVLDELVKKQADGLMLFWPMAYEDCSEFMERLKSRNLQVLFYCHGSWPARGEADNANVSLQKMADAGVDYVTTTASNTKAFRQLTKKPH